MLIKALKDLRVPVASQPWFAGLIVSMTWYELLNPRLLRFKTLLRQRFAALLSGNPADNRDLHDRLKPHVDYYLCLDKSQRLFLQAADGVAEQRCSIYPGYCDESRFLADGAVPRRDRRAHWFAPSKVARTVSAR